MSITLPAPAIPGGEYRPAAGPLERIRARCGAILQERGPELMDPPPADGTDITAAYQQQVYRDAWVNSLRLSGHADYARYRLGVLKDEQFPRHLETYVDQLAKARHHNRRQLKLPAEERKEVRPSVLHLLAAGGVGVGKTAAAAAAGTYAVEHGLMTRFVSHSMYLAWLRPEGAPSGLTATQVRERYERCDLLILDDLCNEMDEYATNHVRTHTSNLITARINSGRATLFTTNLDFDQVTTVLGERLASRIGGGAQVLQMVGDDRRKPKRWGAASKARVG
ncbi:ATP-binding protein [Streptomyces sp. NPDC127110]|uniref:ATP-binding protein n=1 Tax=Streptomyces sp. NPDC127110 TaxID=3345362 RepID=UPI00363AAB41